MSSWRAVHLLVDGTQLFFLPIEWESVLLYLTCKEKERERGRERERDSLSNEYRFSALRSREGYTIVLYMYTSVSLFLLPFFLFFCVFSLSFFGFLGFWGHPYNTHMPANMTRNWKDTPSCLEVASCPQEDHGILLHSPKRTAGKTKIDWKNASLSAEQNPHRGRKSREEKNIEKGNPHIRQTRPSSLRSLRHARRRGTPTYYSKFPHSPAWCS